MLLQPLRKLRDEARIENGMRRANVYKGFEGFTPFFQRLGVVYEHQIGSASKACMHRCTTPFVRVSLE